MAVVSAVQVAHTHGHGHAHVHVHGIGTQGRRIHATPWSSHHVRADWNATQSTVAIAVGATTTAGSGITSAHILAGHAVRILRHEAWSRSHVSRLWYQ